MVVPAQDQIQTTAYERWERHGRTHGEDRADWVAAEQDLLFSLNYEVTAFHALDGTATVTTSKGRVVCRFCEQSAPSTTFDGSPWRLPAFLGARALVCPDICDECGATFRASCEGDLERLTEPFRAATATGNGRVESRNHELLMDVVPTRPFVPIAAYKGLVGMALATVPGPDLAECEDAVEWVGNPDHEFDSRLFGDLICILHILPTPVPTPWMAVARRIDAEAPVPYLLFFLGLGRAVFEVPIPLCGRDADLDGDRVLVPKCAAPLGPGRAPDPIGWALLPMTSATPVRGLKASRIG